MPSRMLLAIDPGLSGGLSLYTEGAGVLAVAMPPTEGDVVTLLRRYKEIGLEMAVVENVPWVVGSKVNPASTGKLQRNVGVIHGALLGLGIQHRLVAPQDWQRPLRLGTCSACSGSTEWKNKLKAEAQRRFPHITVTLATADSLLILDWARTLGF